MWWPSRGGAGLWAPILVLFLTAGCGYRLENRAHPLPAWISSIYVEPFTNRSNELDLGAMITRELRDEFLKGNALSLAPRGGADVILRGQVVEVDTSGLSYRRYDQAVERRIAVRCHVSIDDARSGEEIWSTSDIVREEGFYVGRTLSETEAHKREALKKIASDIAEMVYHRITGVF